MNVAAGGPAGALERGPAAGSRRRAPLASLRIGEPPRSRAAGPQGPFVQVINCSPKRVRSSRVLRNEAPSRYAQESSRGCLLTGTKAIKFPPAYPDRLEDRGRGG